MSITEMEQDREIGGYHITVRKEGRIHPMDCARISKKLTDILDKIECCLKEDE